MQTLLIVILLAFATPNVAAIVGYSLRPSRPSKSDAMQQAIGDAPTLPHRGGYALMDEKAPMRGRPSNAL